MNAWQDTVAAWMALPSVERLGWTLVHFLWQGAAVGLLVAAALAALRRAPAGPRYLACCLGMLLMAACPVATFFTLENEINPRPSSVAHRTDSGAVAGATPVAGRSAPADALGVSPRSDSFADVRSQPISPATATTSPSSASNRSWVASLPTVDALLPWMVAAWLLGVAGLTLRLCGGWWRIQRLRRRAVRPLASEIEATVRNLAARLRVTRPVALLESALVEVPTVIGWLRPAILLPGSALMGLSPRQLEAILAHELAHIRRHDYLVNLFQTALETLLFYHPAVWLVSRAMRNEREACCDEIAVAVCGDRMDYARALASLEAARPGPRQLALAANGGQLLNRIRRLVGVAPSRQAHRSAWWIMAAAAVGVLAMFAMQGPSDLQAEGPNDNADRPASAKPGAAADAPADDWGPETNGLRCRLVAVDPATDDEAPDATKTAERFASNADVTFAVELQNVGEKPLTLLGVRYGDSYPSAEGQLNTAFFGPHLFQFEFTGPDGTPLARPAREYVGGALEISGASTHEIAAGESLTVALRPAQFGAPMDYKLPPGDYRGRVSYLGPSKETLAEIAKHWPDKSQARAWSGEAASNEVAFAVGDDPLARPAELVWGEAHNGLQAAAEFRQTRGKPSPDDPAGTYPLNTVLDVVFHIKNVSEAPISLVSETWRQDDNVFATNEAGEEQQLTGSWYSGWPIMVRWTLRPGEVAELAASNLAVAADQSVVEQFEHPVGKALVTQPGKYLVRHVIRFGGLQSRDEDGNVVIPGPADWQGEISTGETPLTFRARTPADDERNRIPTFVGRIEFVGPEGAPVEAGTFTLQNLSQRGEPAGHDVHAGPIEVPDCTAGTVTLYVRAPGYEEAVHYNVQLTADETKRIELVPTTATRFRLISSEDGSPVAGARVRYFNKNCSKAGGGPFPMKGTEGPIWAVSQEDGTVVLDTLQRIDPLYAELGDALYYFYIEPLGHAPRFLGPVRAGEDLGELTVGPYLEVRGEIRGTPAELDRFAAEWDQPFELTTDNPQAAWLYAVSQTLETQREGDKLTFRLTGLRPGKLRIVANFGPNPHQVSHTYGRRDPGETDVVGEIELTQSRRMALTPEGVVPNEDGSL